MVSVTKTCEKSPFYGKKVDTFLSPLLIFAITSSHLNQTGLCCVCVFSLLPDVTLSSLYEISPLFSAVYCSCGLGKMSDNMLFISSADKPHNPMVNAGAIVISSLIKVKSKGLLGNNKLMLY